MKYTRQRNDFSCVPVAILNMLKWAGEKVALNSKTYKKIYKDCECNKDGTKVSKIGGVLKKYCKLKVKSAGNVLNHLKDDGVILLGFSELGWEHCIVIIKYKRKFLAINYRTVEPYIKKQKETVCSITKKHLSKMLSNRICIWLVKC